jgi:hypothetical protein
MDEIEGGILSSVPPAALNLNLTRATIKMEHSRTWQIDKSNPVDDLIICLEGRGHYLVDGEARVLEPGDAMLIFRGQRFVGWNEQAVTYRGVAQHFNLDIYGRHNLIAQMDLKPKVRLSRWSLLEPLVRHYRQSAPALLRDTRPAPSFHGAADRLYRRCLSRMGGPPEFPAGGHGRPRPCGDEGDHDDFGQSARP